MGKIVFLVGLLCIWSIAAALAAGASSLGRMTGQLQSAEVDSCRGIVTLWPATETIYLQGRETVGIGFPPLGSLFGI